MKKIFFSIYLVVSGVFILLLIEGTLFFAEKKTNSHRFKLYRDPQVTQKDSLVNSRLPTLKIAVFGGSAANGYNSERSFAQILAHLLRKDQPQKNIIMHNYAENGRPFHRYEAELAKKAVSNYDLIIIYAGTNEGMNAVNDSGYFLKPEFKNVVLSKAPVFIPKDSPAAPNPQPLIYNVAEYLESHSRLYSFMKRIFLKFRPPESEPMPYRIVRLRRVESEPVVTLKAREDILTNYRADLSEIISIAQSSKKTIVVLNEISDETFEPVCSFNPELAIDYFNKGMSLFRKKEYKLAHSFLRKSIDKDCFPIRTLTGIFKINEELASKYPNVTYVDTDAFFQRLLAKGYEYPELFTDPQHPTILGHSILAQSIYCSLQKCRTKTEDYDFRALAISLKAELGVKTQETADQAFMSARMNISFAARTSTPDTLLNRASAELETFEILSSSEPREIIESKAELYRFFIESLRSETGQDKALFHINKALKKAPGFLLHHLSNESLATGEALHDLLKKMGITYSKQKNIFESSPH